MSEVTQKEIDNWVRRMERCHAAIPEGLEAHVSYTHVMLYPRGRLSVHMDDMSANGFGISDDSDVGMAITGHNFIPYSEGT